MTHFGIKRDYVYKTIKRYLDTDSLEDLKNNSALEPRVPEITLNGQDSKIDKILNIRAENCIKFFKKFRALKAYNKRITCFQ